MQRLLLPIFLLTALAGCAPQKPLPSTSTGLTAPENMPFAWENATVYFLLTDRFANGDPSNDLTLDRTRKAAPLRNFMGGDFVGITQKIEEGYFDSLGVNALWFTPPVEQIRGATDEGTGLTYAYHGYWARDWTAIDPNFGTREELATLVATAHEHDIRIMWDAVINHTGPVTMQDPSWPATWVRIEPACDFSGYDGTVHCTLVENLPDVRTGSEREVALPPFLAAKWKAEGRYEEEMAELDAFFRRTGYPRTPRYYLIKWLVDWIEEFGIDAFRIDTAKHTEGDVWEDLKREALRALRVWKKANPALKPDDLDFFMTGEVYGYQLGGGTAFSYGDTAVNFFDHSFESMINFGFKYDAEKTPDSLFSQYAAALNGGALDGLSVLNYLSSHDDGQPFDAAREKPMLAGTLLLLAPGSAQIYYGDETARPLQAKRAVGDANLRTFMNWEALTDEPAKAGHSTQNILTHWQKLGRFRQRHLSVGMGTHEQLQAEPYVFRRQYQSQRVKDEVIVGMGLTADQEITLPVGTTFPTGSELRDAYSGQTVTVEDGQVSITPQGTLVLLEAM